MLKVGATIVIKQIDTFMLHLRFVPTQYPKFYVDIRFGRIWDNRDGCE